MRIYYDCEFLERGNTVDLLSIGMVRDDGAELYAVNADMDTAAVRSHPFLGPEVWPLLPLVNDGSRLDTTHDQVLPWVSIGLAVGEFIKHAGPNVQLWSYISSHDHVALSSLFGTFDDHPPYLPHRTNDLAQEMERIGMTQLPSHPGTEHHALSDARWHRRIHAAIEHHRKTLHRHGAAL